MSIEPTYNAKAARDGYHPSPFFFSQKNTADGSLRWLAWSSVGELMERLTNDVLQRFSEDLEVLLKIEKQDTSDGPAWSRFHGAAKRTEVCAAIESVRSLIYGDGYTQLCVRDSPTGNYIALDEYGILFIYWDDENIAHICREAGFEQRQHELISARPHWRKRIPDAADLQRQLIDLLRLRAVS